MAALATVVGLGLLGLALWAAWQAAARRRSGERAELLALRGLRDRLHSYAIDHADVDAHARVVLDEIRAHERSLERRKK